MKFIQQYQKGTENFWTYVLSAIIVLMGLLVGNMLVLALGQVMGKGVIIGNAANPLANYDTNTQLVLLMLPFATALLALVLSIKFVHKRPILTLFTARSQFDWKRYFFAFGVWMFILVALLAISMTMSDQIYWNLDSSTFVMLLAISLVMFPIQTAAEEAFFRGWLLQGFGLRLKHAGWSILLAGIIFGLLHGANPEVDKLGYGIFAYYIISGIFLGVIAHLDDGLELGMGYHAANNLFAAVILTTDWQAFHTDAMFIDKAPPSFGWENILTLVIIQPLFLLIFGKIYKWKNWKSRLFKSYTDDPNHNNRSKNNGLLDEF